MAMAANVDFRRAGCREYRHLDPTDRPCRLLRRSFLAPGSDRWRAGARIAAAMPRSPGSSLHVAVVLLLDAFDRNNGVTAPAGITAPVMISMQSARIGQMPLFCCPGCLRTPVMPELCG